MHPKREHCISIGESGAWWSVGGVQKNRVFFGSFSLYISHLLGLVGRPGGGHAGGGLVQAPEIGKKKEEELNRREFQQHLAGLVIKLRETALPRGRLVLLGDPPCVHVVPAPLRGHLLGDDRVHALLEHRVVLPVVQIRKETVEKTNKKNDLTSIAYRNARKGGNSQM